MNIKTIEMTNKDEFDYAVSTMARLIEKDHDIYELKITHLETKNVATFIYGKKVVEKPQPPISIPKYEEQIGDTISIPSDSEMPKEFFEFLSGRDITKSR
jgi:hypothetical protein